MRHDMKALKEMLEQLYHKLNKRRFVHPDPLEFLYDYHDLRDREIVALVASSLAYGRVLQIVKSVSDALSHMKPLPFDFIMGSSERVIKSAFVGFKHRFTVGQDLSHLLIGARKVINRHGSLGGCLAASLGPGDDTILPALCSFASELCTNGKITGLLPRPGDGSACKRLNLFLRWMVRSDEVDPGGWRGIPRSKLIVPLDTHMHRIGIALGFTKRRAADMRTAMEITHAFATISPDDPVKYDFALTRLGIRKDADIGSFLKDATRHKTLVNTPRIR